MNKETKIFFLILILALIIRLPGLFHFAAVDEIGWLSWDEWKNWHPPLSILVHSFFRLVFGNFVWVSKLLLMLVGLANICLVYLIARRVYNNKSALFSAAIMAFSAYSILASLQIDIDGSFLMFFYLLSSFSFVEFEQTKKRKWKVLTGVFAGLAILTKYPGIFILGILFVYKILKEKKVAGAIRLFIPITLIALSIFSIFPISSLIIGSGSFTDSINHLVKYVSPGEFNLALLVIQYLLSVIWLGPFFLFLLLLSLKKVGRKDYLFLIWIFVIIIFYTFVNSDNFKPIERYFAILVAPLSLIIGNYLSKIKLNKKHLMIFSIVFLFSTITLLMFNGQGDFIPFYPKTAFIQRAIDFEWNFYLPITGSSGPIGFFVNFNVIAYSFIFTSAAAFVLFFMKPRAFKVLVCLLLAVSISYNFFIVQEYLTSSTTPSVNKVSYELLDYSTTNHLEEPIYVFRNKVFRHYLQDFYDDIRIINFDSEFNQDKVDDIRSNAKTVIVIDFPTMNKESFLWQEINACKKEGEFSDKGVILGYVFIC